jgi:hypothetical protein
MSLLSWLFFGWVDQLVKRGSTEPLGYDDLLPLPPKASPKASTAALWREWTQVCLCVYMRGRGQGERRWVMLKHQHHDRVGTRWAVSAYRARRSVPGPQSRIAASALQPTGLPCRWNHNAQTQPALKPMPRAAPCCVQTCVRGRPSLLRAIVGAYGAPYLRLAFLKVRGRRAEQHGQSTAQQQPLNAHVQTAPRLAQASVTPSRVRRSALCGRCRHTGHEPQLLSSGL